MTLPNPIDPTVPPSGTGCVECLAADGWWLHLRRCAQCGHIGCCDSSPAQHASKHAQSAGHPVVQSFEPNEDWFWDYAREQDYDGPTLAPSPRTIRRASRYRALTVVYPATGKHTCIDVNGAVTKPIAVLFDVDGTLIDTGGSGARSWNAAFEKLYGIPADIGKHTSAGETDPQVAAETFRGVLDRDPSADELGRLYAQYLLHLADDIWTSAQYRILPGAEPLLVRLGEAGVILGLVSGAMEGAARTKLMPANLNRFFLFGVYGSDSSDRSELTRLGIEKASHLHAQLTPADVFVVGDTPRDIDAANAAGAVSIGVASGHYTAAELADAGGAHVLGSLEEPFPGL